MPKPQEERDEKGNQRRTQNRRGGGMSAKARLFQEVLQRLKQGTPYVRSAEVAALAR